MAQLSGIDQLKIIRIGRNKFKIISGCCRGPIDPVGPLRGVITSSVRASPDYSAGIITLLYWRS